jgi:hypothetical protein
MSAPWGTLDLLGLPTPVLCVRRWGQYSIHMQITGCRDMTDSRGHAWYSWLDPSRELCKSMEGFSSLWTIETL